MKIKWFFDAAITVQTGGEAKENSVCKGYRPLGRMMKRTTFLLVLALAIIFCFAGCTRNNAVEGNSNVFAAITEREANVPQSSLPTETEAMPIGSSDIGVERYPIPEDNQFYGRFTEADDAWMDADGNIWLGDTQFTFNKDPIENGEVNSSQPPALQEPVDLASIAREPLDLKPSKMEPEEHPEEWLTWETIVSLADFNDTIAAKNSNFQPQGSDFAWNNGAITLMAYYVMPGSGPWSNGAYGIKAWYTWEWTDECIEWNNGFDAFTVNPEEKTMSGIMACWLWNTMAELDIATTIAEFDVLTPIAQDYVTFREWRAVLCNVDDE